MFTSGHNGVLTILFEVVVSSEMWIWQLFFGVIVLNKDINILDRSLVFDEVFKDRAPKINYSLNGINYNIGYYLTV